MVTKAVASSTTQVKNGLLPTPPMPKDLPKANLTDNARQVLMKRYVRRGDDGKRPNDGPNDKFCSLPFIRDSHSSQLLSEGRGSVSTKYNPLPYQGVNWPRAARVR